MPRMMGKDSVPANRDLPAATDLVVIGGGILGCYSALRLARAGVDVVLLERDALFREASGVNAGGFAIQTTAPEITPQAIASVAQWSRMHDELGEDIGFVRTGGLRVATSEAEAAMLQKALPRLSGLGLRMEWLDAVTLRRDLAWLGPAIVGASFCAEEGFAVPMQAGVGFRRALAAAGAHVAERTPALGLAREGAGILVRTARGDIRAMRLLIAGGAWSGLIAEHLGSRLPLVLKTFMLTVTERAPRFIDALITHAQRNLTIKQFGNGTCVIGGGWPGAGALDPVRKDIDVLALARNLAHATAVIPRLTRIGVTRSWAGLEGATADELPLFGRLLGHDNVFVLGCVRGGFVLGPILAPRMADFILGQDVAEATAFSPQRFALTLAETADVP
jgi:glycine/D-amino acid oxidase-like deaminating enzyme